MFVLNKPNQNSLRGYFGKNLSNLNHAFSSCDFFSAVITV